MTATLERYRVLRESSLTSSSASAKTHHQTLVTKKAEPVRHRSHSNPPTGEEIEEIDTLPEEEEQPQSEEITRGVVMRKAPVAQSSTATPSVVTNQNSSSVSSPPKTPPLPAPRAMFESSSQSSPKMSSYPSPKWFTNSKVWPLTPLLFG